MVERILKNGKREGLGISGSVVGPCKRGKSLSRLTECRNLLDPVGHRVCETQGLF